jgi:hypothetical protein
VRTKVVNFELLIIFVWLDIWFLSPIFFYKILNLKSKFSYKFDYKESCDNFLVEFVGMDLKCDIFNVVIF